MKIKIEDVGTPEEWAEREGKYGRGLRNGRTAALITEIAAMKIGQSFEVQGRYCLAETIRAAFKAYGWKTTIRTEKCRPEVIDAQGYRIFKIRAWRVV